jgi:hypothetical protein
MRLNVFICHHVAASRERKGNCGIERRPVRRAASNVSGKRTRIACLTVRFILPIEVPHLLLIVLFVSRFHRLHIYSFLHIH